MRKKTLKEYVYIAHFFMNLIDFKSALDLELAKDRCNGTSGIGSRRSLW
jgi:hypothetical protein